MVHQLVAGGKQAVHAVDEREDAEVGSIKEKGQYITGDRSGDQPCTERLDQLLWYIFSKQNSKALCTSLT